MKQEEIRNENARINHLDKEKLSEGFKFKVLYEGGRVVYTIEEPLPVNGILQIFRLNKT